MLAVVLLMSAGLAAAAQELRPAVAGGRPAFAVASVKENTGAPDGPRVFAPAAGGGVTIVNQTVRQLIYSAYQTQDYRIIGGPDWLRTARFDIAARADADVPLAERLLMLRTLLADRFGLVMRADVRELPVYTMTLAREDRRPGPALRPSACGLPSPNGLPAAGTTMCGNRSAPGVIGSGGASMDALANQLGRLAEISRPVINATRLPGSFDYELSFAPANAAADAGSQERVSIFTALQEQLGLTLRPSTAPVNVMIIEGASRPMPD